MDKRSLSERDICTKFIMPALRKASPPVTHAHWAIATMRDLGLLLPNPDNGCPMFKRTFPNNVNPDLNA